MNVAVSPTDNPDVFTFQCDADGTALSGEITRADKGLAITKATIEAADITGSLLRRIQYGEILLHAQLVIPPKAPKRPVPQPKGTPYGGRAALTGAFLREVAEMYLREAAPGQPSGAVRRMAEHFGRPEQTVRSWLNRARQRGWLGQGRPGRRAAIPGARLMASLNCEICHGAPPEGLACTACGTGTREG
jgi:transposase-like protein